MNKVKQAIRQTGISVFMTIAAIAVQHTTWAVATQGIVSIGILGLGALLVFAAASED